MSLKKRYFAYLVVFLSLFLPLNTIQLYALSGSQFKAGHIIDDEIFFDKGTTNAGQIQDFLNRMVPVCDTFGTKPHKGTTRAQYGSERGNPPPYVCLKDYRQQTVAKPAEAGLCNGYPEVTQSAAEIIYGVAQSCGINPQVLIVLLQKEQGLVKDDWPWASLYTIATGYACPDDAPCDAQFFGFFNQVYSAALQFKRYAANPNKFNYVAGRTSFVQYNPDESCGGSRVRMQNKATAALYNYTPYQPNKAALDNLYGNGDECSAYGNRNFWRDFNDWFGSTYVPPPVPSAALLVNGSRNNVVEYGSGATISRVTQNVTKCTLEPGRGVDAQGKVILANVRDATDFTLACTGPYGNTSDKVHLEIRPPTFGYLRTYIAHIPVGDGKDAVKNVVSNQLDQAERGHAAGKVGAAKYALIKTVSSVEDIAASERLPKQIVDDYAHAVRALANAWGDEPIDASVTVSDGGCYIRAPGTPGYSLEYGAFEDLRGFTGIDNLGAGGMLFLPTQGEQGIKSYGVIRDNNGNTVANNSVLITDNKCP